MRTDPIEDLWGKIDLSDWRNTPCTVGRLANEQDVRAGRAVFYGESTCGVLPVDLDLPHCGFIRNQFGQTILVVAIQAERHEAGKVLVGYRPVNGGNGICTLDEVEFLDGPNSPVHPP